jgi:hypothetical protein
MAEEKIFADGFMFKPKRDDAPEWVLGRLSIKVEDAVAFLKANAKGGWVNIDIKKGKSGKEYCELDTWQPNKAANTEAAPQVASAEDTGLPF